jgi:hypothetical protein
LGGDSRKDAWWMVQSGRSEGSGWAFLAAEDAEEEAVVDEVLVLKTTKQKEK